MNNIHRYIARIILQAETALFVGSGENSLIYDALVQRDHHGFPMIQGTSLTGVLRHALEDKETTGKWASFFGFGKREKSENLSASDGEGSKVKISSAYLLFPNGKIAEGLLENDDYDYYANLTHFTNLPTRQHVRITHQGVAKENGLFENEVVYKGCRFLFEIELVGDGNKQEQENWKDLLQQLKHPLFRIGQGTRNGYGKLSVESCFTNIFNLSEDDQYKDYLNFDPSLSAKNDCLKNKEIPESNGNLTKYSLALTPDDFFIFGSGYGDDEVDNTPFTEDVLVYGSEKFDLKSHTVIPASSIKGAISHRTCFYYNKLKPEPVFADKLTGGPFDELSKTHISTNNTAVATLFGVGAGDEDGEKTQQRGRIIIDDLFYNSEKVENDKIFNHVAIDRFTGGAIDGALFSERVSQNKEGPMILNIYVEEWNHKKEDPKSKAIENALEESLKDICRGLLPLGGMTTKGHGLFSGTLIKNGTQIYPNERN